MPRSIIDTESSRPRYVRRLILTWVFLALGVAAAVVVALALWGHFAHAAPGK